MICLPVSFFGTNMSKKEIQQTFINSHSLSTNPDSGLEVASVSTLGMVNPQAYLAKRAASRCATYYNITLRPVFHTGQAEHINTLTFVLQGIWFLTPCPSCLEVGITLRLFGAWWIENTHHRSEMRKLQILRTLGWAAAHALIGC